MIYDTFEYLPLYLPPSIRDEIVVCVQKLCPHTPDGKYPIRSSDIYAQISTYKTEPLNNRRPEVHRNYIDIQIVLFGTEYVCYSPLKSLHSIVPSTGYDEERDVEFFKDVPNELKDDGLKMNPGNFAVFFPQDDHTPQCTPNHKRLSIRIYG